MNKFEQGDKVRINSLLVENSFDEKYYYYGIAKSYIYKLIKRTNNELTIHYVSSDATDSTYTLEEDKDQIYSFPEACLELIVEENDNINIHEIYYE